MSARDGECYERFRTGFSFADIYQMLRIECERGKRRHVTRRTVLGKWREIKQRMFAERGECCEPWNTSCDEF